MPEKNQNPTDAPTIVYMGTPDFAVPTLIALHQSRFKLTWVVTQPDRPGGRGRQMLPPPVKKVALDMGYEVVQPETVRDETFMKRLHELAPDYLVVVAFGQILPQSVLSVPRHCAINVHGSLLPKYRGPAPIQWALMRGEETTGVTTILMDHGVDTGDMLLKSQTTIEITDTAATLHDRLAGMGAELLVETIEGMIAGSVFPHAQKNDHATYAPMLKKENGRIQWQQSAHFIDAHIRAMTPWPGAFCKLGTKRYKIHQARPIPNAQASMPAGTVVPSFPDELRIATGEGVLSILEIQADSAKRMSIKKFLNGTCVVPGEIFT